MDERWVEGDQPGGGKRTGGSGVEPRPDQEDGEDRGRAQKGLDAAPDAVVDPTRDEVSGSEQQRSTR